MTSYSRHHKLAKFAVCLTVMALMCLGRITGLLIIDLVAVVVWFWGVNAVAYFLEWLDGSKHEHPII